MPNPNGSTPSASRPRKRSQRHHQRNPYDHMGSMPIASALERSQLSKYGTKGATGFSAEDANSLNDVLHGRKVEDIGRNNELNGADRIVNGQLIQTKYFSSASQTLGSAFGEDGIYRYRNMQLEVPADQYEECLEKMRRRIENNQVPGFSDPADAEAIVKKGSVTYEQARNIAKAGNIDSLKFDAKNQVITSSYALAISFSISFARATWDGQKIDEALVNSFYLGLSSAGTSFITGVVSSQLLRSQTARAGVVVVREGVVVVGKTQIGKQAIHKFAQASLGKAVYGGAAINHVSKVLRSNAVTSVVTTVVLTTPDLYRASISKRMSWAQVGKNLAVNATGVAGGSAGWVVGSAAGAAAGSAVPVIGTAVGAFIGGMAGALVAGLTASKASKAVLDRMIDDDSIKMVAVLEKHILDLCWNYLLSADEVSGVWNEINPHISEDLLRDIYSSNNRRKFIASRFEHYFEAALASRETVCLPGEIEVGKALETVSYQVERSMEKNQAKELGITFDEADCTRNLGTELAASHLEMVTAMAVRDPLFRFIKWYDLPSQEHLNCLAEFGERRVWQPEDAPMTLAMLSDHVDLLMIQDGVDIDYIEALSNYLGKASDTYQAELKLLRRKVNRKLKSAVAAG